MTDQQLLVAAVREARPQCGGNDHPLVAVLDTEELPLPWSGSKGHGLRVVK